MKKLWLRVRKWWTDGPSVIEVIVSGAAVMVVIALWLLRSKI